MFNFPRNIEKKIGIMSKIALVCIIIFLILAPVFFGSFLIALIVVLVFGLFEFSDLEKSLKQMTVVFLMIVFISLPFFILFVIEKNKINHLETVVDRNHPKIIQMTEEFKTILGKISPDYTEYVAETIENYVYSEISLKNNSFLFPKMNKIMNSLSSNNKGRALVGYAILKNLGYNVYIVTGFAEGSHTWLRIYEKEPISLKVQSSEEEKFSEAMSISYAQRVWVMSSEDNVFWDSSWNQLYSIFSNGFKMKNIQSAFIVNLFFVLPVFLIGFCLFLVKGIKNNRDFVLMFLWSSIAIILSGMLGVIFSVIYFLPIIVGSGLYLRWLNRKFN